MPLRVVNVTKVRLIVARIPDAGRQSALVNIQYDPELASGTPAETTFVSVRAKRNAQTKVEIPVPAMAFRNGGLLLAKFDIAGVGSTARPHTRHSMDAIETIGWGGFATLIQASDLAMTLKVGLDEAIIHVTSATDARPRAGAVVRDIDVNGRVVAQAM